MMIVVVFYVVERCGIVGVGNRVILIDNFCLNLSKEIVVIFFIVSK